MGKTILIRKDLSFKPKLRLHEVIQAPELRAPISGAHCGVCNPLVDLANLPFQGYEHDGGVQVKGFDKKQWVYVTCPQCGEKWAYWKLLKHAKRFKELGF